MKTIYELRDPRTGEIRYVGQSVNPKVRLHGHIFDARCLFKSRKGAWIQELQALGMKPDVVSALRVRDDLADKAEMRHIGRVMASGARLLNYLGTGETRPHPNPAKPASERKWR
jgi:hypothetical protein